MQVIDRGGWDRRLLRERWGYSVKVGSLLLTDNVEYVEWKRKVTNDDKMFGLNYKDRVTIYWDGKDFKIA
jgi:hypothetical protein